jgi:transposase
MAVRAPSSFVCEFELATTSHDRRVLRARLETGRQLYNAVLGDLLRRLRAARRDPVWAAACALPSGRTRATAFRQLRDRYGLSEYAAHKHPSLKAGCWIREHLDINTAQKVSTRAWRAVEQHMYGGRGRPRFKRRGELVSVEGKTNRSGIRFCFAEAQLLDSGRGGESTRVEWNGAHCRLALALVIDRGDEVRVWALAHPVKYVRIVRRIVRGRERFSCQLVVEGQPLQKRPAGAGGRFGIDVGPSTVAVSDQHGNAQRHRLADGVSDPARARRRYQRKLDRQRRANNPDSYDQQGRAVRGQRPRRQSKRMRATERQLAETQRRLAARRHNEHGRLANQLIANLGPLVHAEKLSYRSFQRCFGRSVRDRAPGRFIAELERKAAQHGGGLVQIPTHSTWLSQRCVCGNRQRKDLSERRHRCGCEHVPDGFSIDRDELAAFLAIFCDQHGHFDQHAAQAAWEGGANDRLLRADKAREPADKPRAPAPAGHRPTRKRLRGQSGSAGKRQRTPVRPPHAKRADGQPRGQRRTPRSRPGAKPPRFSHGDH